MTALITTALAWIGGNRWALTAAKWGAIALTVLLFLLSIRRAGERAGRLAERLEAMEKANDVQRHMLDAAARRPRDRDELAERLRDGRLSEPRAAAVNRAENSHLPFRRRERAMLRFRRMRSLQMFAAVHASVYNLFNHARHLSSRRNFKLNRTAALAEWRGLCAA